MSEDRLELEQELLLTSTKAKMINKYIDELEENEILTKQWFKTKQELDKYKNIVDEVLESVCCIEHNLDKYEEIGLDHLEYAQNKIAELKEYLIELKGE